MICRQAMITGEVKRLCQYLGQYKTECELIVTTLVPQGIGQLVEKIVSGDDALSAFNRDPCTGTSRASFGPLPLFEVLILVFNIFGNENS